jgi:hypothetical protein
VTTLEALAAVVSGEDAAIYAYSVAGAHVKGSGRRAALAALDAHRANRDRAASLIVATGGTPPGSATAYALPGPVDSAATAKSLMAQVDNSLVPVYADAVAFLSDAQRRWAVRAGVECATRAVSWGAASQAFPTGPARAVSSASPSPTAG